MSSESKHYSVEIRDPELRKLLDGADVTSEVLRDGLRELAKGDETTAMADLSEKQRRAYDWLTQQDGRVELEEAETSIAVETQLDAKLVRRSILMPLQALGLIEVDSRLWGVDIVAVDPVECAFCSADMPPARTDEHISQEHSWGGSDE